MLVLYEPSFKEDLDLLLVKFLLKPRGDLDTFRSIGSGLLIVVAAFVFGT